MALSLTKDVAAWVEFVLLDKDTNLPIAGVPVAQVQVYYKKHGALSFTEKTDLVEVADASAPGATENYVHIGFGVYAVKFTTTELDTLETFTYVVTPANSGVRDFQQVTGQIDIVPAEHGTTVEDIATDLGTLSTLVEAEFEAAATNAEALASQVETLETNIALLQAALDEVQATIPSGITATFTE